MWIWLVIGSALMLGLYDVAKKQSLRRNSVLAVLLVSTFFSALIMAPWLTIGPASDHLGLFFKACLVTASWVSGLAAMGLVPLSTVSTVKASRPVFVLVFSLILFAERLNALQWAGCLLAVVAIFLLSRTSRSEGVSIKTNRGVVYLAISVITGVVSALYDKHILGFMDPVFVQSWTNVYITLILLIVIAVRRFLRKPGQPAPSFRWDWMLPLIAVLITAADFMYFRALSSEGSLLSVVSMTRRLSVVVPFVFGALFWHEKNIAAKGFSLLLMLSGIALITLGSI